MSIFFSSCPIVPTAAPVSPSGYPVPDTSSLIFLNWSPVPAEHLNGILLFYVTEVITNNSWTFHAVQTHIVIGPLHPFYTYRCKVAAFTTALGPFTPEFYVNSGETCGLHVNKPDKPFEKNVLAWQSLQGTKSGGC